MIALENQLDIQALHKQGFSCSEIARRLHLNRRTVQRYLEDPDCINRPRNAVIRPSKVDPFREAIAAFIEEDPQYRASRIYDRLKRGDYNGCYELVKRVVRSLKAEQSRKAYIRFEERKGEAHCPFVESQTPKRIY